MISLRNLSIEFPGKRLFSNFNATIFPKDRIGLMGKNGSGKSTLMKAIAGAFKDYQGEINISGKVLYMDQYRTFDAKTPFEYYMKVADTPEKEKQVRSILKASDSTKKTGTEIFPHSVVVNEQNSNLEDFLWKNRTFYFWMNPQISWISNL